MLFSIKRANKKKSFLISDKLHPQTIACVQTRLEVMGLSVKIVDFNKVTEIEKGTSAVLFQYPDTHGSIDCFKRIIDQTHSVGV